MRYRDICHQPHPLTEDEGGSYSAPIAADGMPGWDGTQGNVDGKTDAAAIATFVMNLFPGVAVKRSTGKHKSKSKRKSKRKSKSKSKQD